MPIFQYVSGKVLLSSVHLLLCSNFAGLQEEKENLVMRECRKREREREREDWGWEGLKYKVRRRKQSAMSFQVNKKYHYKCPNEMKL